VRRPGSRSRARLRAPRSPESRPAAATAPGPAAPTPPEPVVEPEPLRGAPLEVAPVRRPVSEPQARLAAFLASPPPSMPEPHDDAPTLNFVGLRRGGTAARVLIALATLAVGLGFCALFRRAPDAGLIVAPPTVLAQNLAVEREAEQPATVAADGGSPQKPPPPPPRRAVIPAVPAPPVEAPPVVAAVPSAAPSAAPFVLPPPPSGHPHRVFDVEGSEEKP
jgi:hypothetical protein